MKRLLIDIGNSNIKSAIGSGNKIYGLKRFEYRKKDLPESLKKVLKNYKEDFDSIGISCLAKKNEQTLRKIIKEKYSTEPYFIKFRKYLPIKIDYEKSLGNDRICSAIAASFKYSDKENILIIDFGTATTYNLILKKVFSGGLITPGILTSLQSLNSKANLPISDLKNTRKLIHKKTKYNITSGIIHQSLFTTEGIIKNLKYEYKNLFIVCTGGLAELIFKKSCLIDKLDRNLVLEGINYILKYKSVNH